MKLEKIKKKFGITIETRPFRKSLLFCFEHIIDWPYATSITDIKVKEYLDRYEITITTHRPGILIGKAGQTINSIEKFLTQEHEKTVKILIKEDKLWHNLYN